MKMVRVEVSVVVSVVIADVANDEARTVWAQKRDDVRLCMRWGGMYVIPGGG
jgi:hypothetical protein